MVEALEDRETLEERVTRLLGNAHAEADNGNYEGAVELAEVAIKDWKQATDV